MSAPTPDFTCECVASRKRLYLVTSTNGAKSVCEYCDDCAALAETNWNGATASVERVMTCRHELRLGMSLYWITTTPESVDGVDGHRWSGSIGRVGGWTAGDRSAALADAREAYAAREALHRLSGVAS